ncbi:BCCT family transporter [Nocardioides malaquae]|uniref:BCCT family transporter n=1 Tax=Nocardioides malaquae TaxID=2773426 RepID=UPI0029D414F5|nr:BCCT family transporter [Nocardioides malaquae]
MPHPSTDADATPDATGGPAGIHLPVFLPAVATLVVAAGLAIAFPAATEDLLGEIQGTIVQGFGWYYVLAVAGFVVFSLWMGLSRFGDIKLGPDEEEPEFGVLAWFGMLFAAGMGIGLVFWGAAEPITFTYTDVKPGMTGEGPELAQKAMAQVFLHWGFHAWAIYVVVGLALAYSIHRRGNPVSIRWALEPLLGDRVRGWMGDVIDTVAVVGTVAGVATSLGLGVTQISSGLVHLGLFDEVSDQMLVVLIVVITLLATVSVVSGVGRGIKWLSNANLALAAVFLVAVLALGPTLFLLREWVQNLGVYARDVIPLSFSTSAFSGEEGQRWQASWTTFYWGWWISWAPFVGVFIARISRGRTVREFVAGVLLVPTMVTFLWFSVLGGAALHREMFGEGGLVGEDADGNPAVAAENVLFDLLGGLPAGTFLSGVAIVLVVIFFITSSDSGSLVVTMLASGGEAEPPTWSRVLWATIEGLVAVGLLLAGGLVALQTGAVITALPFSLIMVAICFATYRALRSEHLVLLRAERRQRREELQGQLASQVTSQVTTELTENFDEHFGDPVAQRVERLVTRRERRRGPDRRE